MNEKKKSSGKISKKQAQDLVYARLAVALAEYKNTMKEKKFIASLKKASKLFADDIAKVVNKASSKSFKAAKKSINTKIPQPQEQPLKG